MKEVAVGILLKDGLILVCQRKRGASYALKWEFPGGKIELGETPETTLERELREELLVAPLLLRPLYTQEWTYPEGSTDPDHDGSFRVFYYIVPAFRGEPSNRVFEQIRWVSPPALLDMDILEGNRDAITYLIDNAHAEQPDPGIHP